MKWQDIKEFWNEFRIRPFRAISMLLFLIVIAFLIAFATGAGKQASELQWVQDLYELIGQSDCETLGNSTNPEDVKEYFEKCTNP